MNVLISGVPSKIFRWWRRLPYLTNTVLRFFAYWGLGNIAAVPLILWLLPMMPSHHGLLIYIIASLSIGAATAVALVTIVTSHRRRLDAERSRYLSLFDAIDEPVSITDPVSAEILYANPAFRRIWPDVADASNEGALVSGPPCLHNTSEYIFGENTGRSHIWEYESGIDGLWFHCIDKAIGWDDERPVKFQLAIDISPRKLGEIANAEQVHFLQSLIDAIPSPIFYRDINGYYRACNAAYSSFFGISRSRIIGRSAYELLPSNYAALYHEKDIELFETGSHQHFETTILSADGKNHHVEFHRALVTSPLGRITGVAGIMFDVTTRRKAEEENNRERNYSVQIIENSPVIICGIDDNGKTKFINKAGERITGYREEHLIGRNWWRIFYPGNDYEQVERLFSALAEGPVLDYEMHLTTRGGEKRIISWNAMFRYDDKKRVKEIIGFGNDITETTRARRAQIESERKYRTLTEGMLDIPYSIDAGGVISFLGPQVSRYGYESEEMIGRHLTDFILPEDHATVLADFKTAMTGTEKTRVTLFRIQDQAGTIRWLEERGRPLTDEQGAVIGVTGMLRDITDRKQAQEELRRSEEKYRSLVDNVKIGIALIDPDLRILSVNNHLRRLFPAIRVNDRPKCYRAYNDPPKEKHCSDCPTVKTLEDGQVHEAVTESTQGAEVRNYRVVSSPVRDEDNNVIAAIEMIEDITDRLRREDGRLKKAKLESVGRLAGGLAHDYNNLLTGIMGNITLARDGDSDESCLHEAEKAVIQAQNLTRQLLTFAEGGAPVKRVYTIGDIVGNAVSFALRGSNVLPDLDIAPEVDSVEIDAGQISQVIHNIVSNATQAMPDGGALKVRIANLTIDSDDARPLSPGCYAVVSFTDGGDGIPPKILPRIFDPYFTTRDDASGLGLATSYSIIQKHRGHIEAESEPGVGTTIRFYLPVISSSSGGPSRPGQDGGQASPARILVLDDEEMLRTLIMKILSRGGHRADCVADGRDALAYYQKHQFDGRAYDLVILDLTIPGGMGGRETIERLRRLNPQVKAIACSGYSNDPILAEYRQHGFMAVVAKPYKPAELLAAIDEVLAMPVPVA